MKSREERIKIQNELKAIYPEVKEALMKIPGVVGVGIGLKEVGDELTEEPCFRVYVKAKKNISDIPPEEIIPDTIKGVKTDVIILPKAKRYADDRRHRPIRGGIQIGNQNASSTEGGAGTLGCLARLVSDNSVVILSNEHVLYHGFSYTGTKTTEALKVGQAYWEKCCCCACGEIGTSLIGLDNSLVDCAIARVNDDIQLNLSLSNNMTDTQIPVAGTDTAVFGDEVRKIGRTSGLTTGTISDINGSTAYLSSSGVKNEQIFINPAGSETFREHTNNKLAFSDGGDSGSVIVNEDDRVVGLLWGGDPNSFTNNDRTFACHIQDVLNELEAEGFEIFIMLTGGGSSARSTPAAATMISNQTALSNEQAFQKIELELNRTQEGKKVLDLVYKHQWEVLGLVNNNKKVTVSWQRKQGPAYVAAILRSIKKPHYQIPDIIEGVSLEDLIEEMAIILIESGSPELKKAIRENRNVYKNLFANLEVY